jgi:outer membrane murein-binding lipoprotein Lpp
MNRAVLIPVLACVVFHCALCSGQSPRVDQVSAILQQLQTQQTELNSNQTKIDTKVSDLAEAVRVARLYTKRAGGMHIAPPAK